VIVVLDIDGTIANNDHRAHYVDRKEGDPTPKDWDGFLQPHLVAKDTIVRGAAKAIEHFTRLGYRLVFLTGRREELRKTTAFWLKERFDLDVTDDQLIMRPVGNMMKPTEYKREQIVNLRGEFPKETFLFVDDDQFMWSVYAEFGIVLRAPECWDNIFPVSVEEEPSNIWRK
jgi:predicted secreted acid phosphatase